MMAQKLVKIYRTLMTWENDRLTAQGLISMEMTMQAADGWELHSIQHAGQKSDNPEIHRYITVYYQDVEPIDAMFYVLDEILKEDTSKFEGKPVEEVIEYIRERYDEKVDENLSEIDSANEPNKNTEPNKP